MTMTMPPAMPGTWRGVPAHPSERQVARLRQLLDQGDGWVLRSDWPRYLRSPEGAPRLFVPIDHLTRDQRVAARAWLRQQRHRLYGAIQGGLQAPDGWLQETPLYRALAAEDDLAPGRTESSP